MIRLALVLTTICIIASLLLAVTYRLTKEQIQVQEGKVEKEALTSVLPEAVTFLEEEDYYKGFDREGNVIGYAFIEEGKGYSSILKVMVGLDLKGNIEGINILSQQETPGLGGRIDEVVVEGTIWDIIKGKKVVKGEPWFQAQFRDKRLDEIQAITGATITSDAVIDIVKNVVGKFKMYQK